MKLSRKTKALRRGSCPWRYVTGEKDVDHEVVGGAQDLKPEGRSPLSLPADGAGV